MATVTPELTVPPPEPIRHPLAKLRGSIRKYVAIEGALCIALFLALWFWISLALDFGSFKLLGLDWVQELPRWFRGLLLSGVVAGLTVVAIHQLIRRLTVDFRPTALAMVMERRFPQELGDRLVTAVELADVDRVERYGYSRAMVVETIREAGARVQQLDVQQVFDWARLRQLAKWTIGIAVLPLLLFGIGYTAVKRSNPLTDFLPRFRDVTVTWFRRDVLLQNVIWPRRAYLEVLDFPASGEMRIGRDAPSPRLRFKAHRWVIADVAAPEGWRALKWSDLRPNWVGGTVPSLPMEALTKQPPASANVAGLIANPGLLTPLPTTTAPRDWTLDQIDIALEEESLAERVRQFAPELFAVFESLKDAVQQPSLRNLIRRLEVPERVEVKYWGQETSSRLELLRGPGWEYVGSLGDLKESVKFRARGADYDTATRSIVIVPPPMLQQLKRIERRPAYQYHRPPVGSPPDGGPLALRGLRQRIEELVSLNGSTSRFATPFGSELTLDGQLDKELTSVVLKPRSANMPHDIPTATISSDRLGFQIKFPPLTTPLDFDLEFTDTDGVRSQRHIVVDVPIDQSPVVNVIIDGIRKNNQGQYLVTPSAMIPFDGKVVDGVGGLPGGLDRVDYSLTINRLESPLIASTQAEWLAAALLPMIGGSSDVMLGNSLALAEVNRIVLANAPPQADRAIPLESFQQLYRDRSAGDVIKGELLNRLEREPGPSALIRDFVVQPRFEYLDLREKLPELKVKSELEVQPRYRMKLTVIATDNNVETGPGVAANKEPPFTVLVVSEAELLVEIAREEESLHLKADDALQRLRETRQKLDKVADDVPSAAADQLPTFAQRGQEMLDATSKSRDIIQEVFSDYSRILRELELNRVSAKIVEKVKVEICTPLESALKVEFVNAEEALDNYRKELEAGRRPNTELTGQTKVRLDRLIDKLSQVLGAMGDVTTINKLISALRDIEKGQEQAIGSHLKELQRLQREKLIRDLEKLKGLEDK
jgi:hypothetical protein